jgi:hypothetical protein
LVLLDMRGTGRCCDVAWVQSPFGDGDSGGFLLDDRAFPGERGGEGVDGEVVDGLWIAAGGVVDDGDGVRSEQGVGPAGDLSWWLR